MLNQVKPGLSFECAENTHGHRVSTDQILFKALSLCTAAALRLSREYTECP